MKATTNSSNNIVIYQNTSGDIKLDVFLEDETVWLSQAQIALLFGKARNTITEHINNVFKENELDEKMVSRFFRHTTDHGAVIGKTQTKEVKYYNLDVIISVGYRVKSEQANQFYEWATELKRKPISESTSDTKAPPLILMADKYYYFHKHVGNDLHWLIRAATEWHIQDELKLEINGYHIKVYAMNSVFMGARALFEFLTGSINTKYYYRATDFGLKKELESKLYTEDWIEPLHSHSGIHLQNRYKKKQLKTESGSCKDLNEMPLEFAKEIIRLWEEYEEKLNGTLKIIAIELLDTVLEQADEVRKSITENRRQYTENSRQYIYRSSFSSKILSRNENTASLKDLKRLDIKDLKNERKI